MGSSIVKRLTDKKLINPPSFLPLNIHYETIMGSVAYGVSSDSSDCDIYGFCIPPKEVLFPHLAGQIFGFDWEKERFEQYQEHHIKDNDKEYDLTIYSIVKFFYLAMTNNPNMVDALFTPLNCVVHCTKIGNMVRDNRKMFLHKGSFHRFRGYAHEQLHKIKTKTPQVGSKRYKDVQKYGVDVKFCYHVVRLLLEAEQILTTGDLDLQRDREVLKEIRRGEWSEKRIRDYFSSKEKSLEEVYLTSNAVPYSPDRDVIKELLLQCLEEHYGSLDKAVVIEGREKVALRKIQDICNKTLHYQ